MISKNNLGWFMPAAVFFLLPFGSMIFVPLIIMAIIGVHVFFRDKLYLICRENRKYRLLILAFGLIWLPMLFSLPDAVNFQHSLKTTLGLIPYVFVGIFLVFYLDNHEARNRLCVAVLAITSFWCVDALFQLLSGSNLFGHAYIKPTRLTGIFHPKFTLGLVLALLLPVVLEQLRRWSDNYLRLSVTTIVAAIHIAVIILTGSKTSLIMMIIGITAWFFYVVYINRKIQWRRIILVLMISVPLAGVLSVQQPSRLDSLLNVFESDLKELDKISSSRFSLWNATLNIAQDHWINGVGPRGFRYVYKDYKPEPGKYNREFPTASTHPHFALLEIMSETGLTGLAAIIFMLFLLFRELLNTPLAFRTRIDLFPWFLGVTIGIVPNIAKAFYSSFWMSIVLCMLFIGIANIAEGNENR